MSDLPVGWKLATFGELMAPEPHSLTDGPFGSKLKTAHYVSVGPRVVRLGNIGVGEFLARDEAHIARDHYEALLKHRVFPGDLLIAGLADPVGRCCLAPGDIGDAIVKADCFRAKPHPEMTNAYLMHYLNSPQGREVLENSSHGLGRLRINLRDLREVLVPVAPKVEQRRIVVKLESLFECTRRAREELSHIPRLIEHYKKAILEAAFRGDLTQDWRSQRALYPVDAESADIDSRSGALPTLPSQWSWASVGAVSAISGGLTKNARRSELSTRAPYLRVANVYTDELRLDEVQEIGCTPKELQKTALKFGDLLIVEGNGSIDQIGRVALWDGSIPVCSHQNHLIRARTGPRIVPEFLLFWMISPLGRQYIERVASSSSGLHTLSISKVSGLPVPLCSIAEMNEIIARIRSRLRDIASLERETSQSALLLDRLDQANLSKAFRGELVPQNPNDEPASVLLERICAARAEQPKNTRKGRGKTANARVAA
jgi:type I restriction enzyme S subunit